MTATWLEHPERLEFETTGEMLRFIEQHPEVLIMYRPADREEEKDIVQI